MSSRIARMTMTDAVAAAEAAEDQAQIALGMLADSALGSIAAAMEAIPNVTNDPACLSTARGTARTSAELLKAAIRTSLQRADSSEANPVSSEAVRIQARLSKVAMKLAQLPPVLPFVLVAMESVTRSAAATQALCAPAPAKQSLKAVTQATALLQLVQSSGGSPSAAAYGLGGMLAAVAVCVTEGAMSLKMTAPDALHQFSFKRCYDKHGFNADYDDPLLPVAAPGAGAGTTAPAAPGSSGATGGTAGGA